MKKYIYGIIGIFIGFSLSLTLTTHADEIKSMVGKAIQGEFPIKVNGKKLDKNAIVIDGSSFLPVKVMGEALGLDVSFNADLGIELKQKEVVKSMTTDTSEQAKIEQEAMNEEARLQNIENQRIFNEQKANATPSPSPTPIPLSLDEQIAKFQSDIKAFEWLLSGELDSNGNPTSKGSINLKEQIDGYKSQLAALEKQKAALTQ